MCIKLYFINTLIVKVKKARCSSASSKFLMARQEMLTRSYTSVQRLDKRPPYRDNRDELNEATLKTSLNHYNLSYGQLI